MGWVANATAQPLLPQERHGTHCIGGWVRILYPAYGPYAFAVNFRQSNMVVYIYIYV